MNAQTALIATEETVIEFVNVEVLRRQTGTPTHLKRMKTLPLRVPRKTRARGSLDEYRQYNKSSIKGATDNTRSAHCTKHREIPTSGKPSEASRDAPTRILPLPKHQSRDKKREETAKIRNLTSRTTRVTFTGK